MKVYRGLFIVWACFFTLFLTATGGYSHTIDASAGEGGTISPSGSVSVTAGADQTFTISPDPDYGILDVMVDGGFVGPVPSYTFTNVTGDHAINASFACANPVMIDGEAAPSFSTIMAAYDYAGNDLALNNFTLKLVAGYMPAEDLLFDLGVSVVLDGGYDCSFLDNSMATIIPGSLTIGAGKVTTSNIVLTASPPCEPGDPNNFPGNAETCDGLDNNCNGLVDDGLTFDVDGDGYSSIGSCGGSADDCNDNNAGIHPYGEIYGDGIDQDCDGQDLIFPVEGDCIDCHGVSWVNQVHRSIYVPAPNGSCAGCHAATVNNILPGHYGQTVRTADNNMAAGAIIGCTSCHDWHDEEYSGYAINGAYIVWAKVHAVGTANETCDTCHENRAADHETGTAHDNRIIDSSCGQCHTSDTSVLGSPGSGTLTSDADVDTLHRSDCTLCHAYTGTKLWGAIVEQAIEAGLNGAEITCLTCHAFNFSTIHANLENHNALINVGTTSCGNCHSDLPPLIDPADPRVHSACSNCHDENFNRISLAIGKTFEAGGDCTTCHGDHFPNHSHHNGVYNDVSYNAAVDTSQSTPQGCAACHFDYDIANGTSLGLSTWETILFEHDLDGTKDGSTNTCDNCHAYGGGSSVPLIDVQNAIASGNPATCATCHTDKAPNFDHGIPDSGKHPEHFAMDGVTCSTCHITGNYPKFKSGTDTDGDGFYDLAETDVCNTCHQDGNGNPAPGDFKSGWGDPEFVLACNSCHQLPPGTGAHSAHFSGADGTLDYGDLRVTEDFTGGLVSSINMIGCGNCHPMVGAFHGNGNWGDVELYNSDVPVGYIKALNTDGSYDGITKTCSNVYCHSVNSWTTDGTVPMPWPELSVWHEEVDPLPRPLPDNIITARVYRDVTWDSGETLTCNGCHENPPQTDSADNDGGAGDSHYWVDSFGYENLHVYNMGSFPPIGCRTCHYDTVREWDETFGETGGWDQDPVTYRRFYNDVAIYDKAKHVNGFVDVVFDTVNNFTYTSGWSGNVTPIDLSVSSFDQATKTCSNVECHIEETEVIWGLPYRWEDSVECDRCHNYSGTFSQCSDCHGP